MGCAVRDADRNAQQGTHNWAKDSVPEHTDYMYGNEE